jgi:hypothetical protein
MFSNQRQVKLIFGMFPVLFAATAFAQNSDSLRPIHKWEVGIAINSVEAQIDAPLIASWGWAWNNLKVFGDQKNKSISLDFVSKRKINNRLKLRFGLGFTNIDLESHYNGINDSGTSYDPFTIKDDTIQQRIYRCNIGLEISCFNSKWTEIYGGLNMNTSIFKNMYWKDNLKSNDTSTVGFDRWVGVTPGGFSIGMAGIIGIKANLSKAVSIGFELSSVLRYYRLGGVQEGDRTYYLAPSPVSNYKWRISNNLASGFGFSELSPSFHLIFQL